MIEGLRFGMPAAELKAYLAERVAHHRERQGWYIEKANDLKISGVVAANMTGGDPVGAMQQKAREHEAQIAVFQFMHDHVIANETYQLGDSDLQRLEIIQRGW